MGVVIGGNETVGVDGGGGSYYDATSQETLLTGKGTLSVAESWGWALLFVTIINLSSIMGILFFPMMKRSWFILVMRGMIGLAVGSLGGSALFHLLPQALLLPPGDHTHLPIFLITFLSVWFVMSIECGLKIILKLSAPPKSVDGEKPLSHSHNHTPLSLPNGHTHAHHQEEEEDEEGEDHTPNNYLNGSGGVGLPMYASSYSMNKVVGSPEGVGHKKARPPIKTVAWLVIIGDSIHNFIDGVSIGAAFVKDFRTGAIISLAIMCEEFPHELGDFAILINSGFSVRRALGVNYASALFCYLGMALGLGLGEIAWAHFIFAFAAGIFLYVALSDMIPEITALVEATCEGEGPWAALKVLLTHYAGILLGLVILYLLAAYPPQPSL